MDKPGYATSLWRTRAGGKLFVVRFQFYIEVVFMLISWGLWVYRFRWWVLIISVLSLGPAAWLTSQGGHLDSVIIPANTKSARALDLIKRELPPTLPDFGLIFRSPTLLATDPAFQAEVERAVTPLRNDPHVASVRTAYDGAAVDSRSISRDGHSTIAEVEIKDYTANETVLAMDIYPKLRAKVHSDTLEVTAFGTLPRNHDLTVLAERDAKRGEMRVLPLMGLLLRFRVRICARGRTSACRRPARSNRRHGRHTCAGPHYPRPGIRQKHRSDGGSWRRYRLLALYLEPVSRGSSPAPRP